MRVTTMQRKRSTTRVSKGKRVPESCHFESEERGRGLSLGGGPRRENIGRNDGLGWFPLVEVVQVVGGWRGVLVVAQERRAS
jgi:hypothetical protein